jgi:hypothetical protein
MLAVQRSWDHPVTAVSTNQKYLYQSLTNRTFFVIDQTLLAQNASELRLQIFLNADLF